MRIEPLRRRPPFLLLLLLSGMAAGPLTRGAAAQASQWDVSHDWHRRDATPAADLSAVEETYQGWPLASLSAPWSQQGAPGRGLVRWYRRSMPVAPHLRDEGAALYLGALRHGWYSVYADGVLVGRHGSEENPVPLSEGRLFRLPSAVTRDGSVEVAVRVVPAEWAAARGGGPAFSGARLGDPESLSVAMEHGSLAARQGTLAVLLFAVVSGLLGLYHLLLYATRPAQAAYLWFAVGAFAFAVNAVAHSPWPSALYSGMGAPIRLTDAAGHVAAGALLLFLWQAFGRSVPRFLRGYVASHAAMAAFVMVVPLGWVVATAGARFFWLVPGLVAAMWLLWTEWRAGHPDVAPLAAGVFVLVVAEMAELGRLAGMPLPPDLPYLGFAAVLLSMAFLLATQFHRVHRELEELREALEIQVAERTAGFAEMTERAREANEAKSRFLATMSHELRTPLNSVIGFSTILRKRVGDHLDPRSRDMLERIGSSGRHLLDLVEDLLDISTIESGRVRLEFSEVAVDRLIGGVLAELGPQAVARGTRLTAVVPSPLAPVTTDRVRFKQILVNLVGNAVKFTHGGSVTVKVHQEAGRPVAIEVTDTGPGIPPDRLDLIFRPFLQVDATPARKHGGAGLGLAITKGLCDLLGYTIAARSTVGEGTTVQVTLAPRGAARPPAPPRRLEASEEATPADGRGDMMGREGGRLGPRLVQEAEGEDRLD